MEPPTSRGQKRWRPVAFAGILTVVGAVGMFALTARDDPTSAQTTPDGKIIEEFAPDQRPTIDDFEARLLDGTTYDSTLTHGTVAVYNVWGSWCGPCRTEAPALARLARETASTTAFVGINVRDNDAAAIAFERSFNIPYPSITTDDAGPAILAFGTTLSASAIPSTVILDRDGRVAARVVGPVTYSTLKALLTTVINEDADLS